MRNVFLIIIFCSKNKLHPLWWGIWRKIKISSPKHQFSCPELTNVIRLSRCSHAYHLLTHKKNYSSAVRTFNYTQTPADWDPFIYCSCQVHFSKNSSKDMTWCIETGCIGSWNGISQKMKNTESSTEAQIKLIKDFYSVRKIYFTPSQVYICRPSSGQKDRILNVKSVL